MQKADTWFATSEVDPDLLTNKTWSSRPSARVVHAKQLGTNLTACGKNATSWYRYWQPFLSACFGKACDECYEAVTHREVKPRIPLSRAV